MKKIIMLLMVGILVISVSVFAQEDVLIDLNGNFESGSTSNPYGRLEVEGADNRDGVVGITGGTGKAVHGINADAGFAGYFDGKVHITSDLTLGVGASLPSHNHSPSQINGIGTMVGEIALNGSLSVVGNISVNNSDGYKVQNVTVLDAPKYNIFVGKNAGANTTGIGDNNSFIGNEAGTFNTIGLSNTFMGNYAGYSNTEGNHNTFIGEFTGGSNLDGDRNTYIGTWAGQISTGDNNVFLGYSAGANETGSNKLYIDNSDTAAPLIHGDFATDMVTITDTLKITPVSAAPQPCNAGNKGAIYVDSDLNLPCFCNGTNWLPMDDFSGVCS